MKIIRVLNTNAVLTKDELGDETVLLGAGIGFKAKPGSQIDENRVEKRFVLKDKKQQSRFQELLNQLPSEYILAAEQIISLARDSEHMKLNESIHISLSDHIHNAVTNWREGISIPNTLLLDIKHFYAKEYAIAAQGLDIIGSTFDCMLPDDEAGFIAMHFVNAEYNKNGNANIKKIILLVREMNQLILSELDVMPDEDSLNYYRYMTHLNFFAQRITENIHYKSEDNRILEAALSKYPEEYSCSKKVVNYISDHYGYSASEEEILYLTVHLTHISNNKDRRPNYECI